MSRIVCLASDLLIGALIIQAVLSFFRLDPRSPLVTLRATLARLTDPLLRPLRRVIPNVGMFDISGMVLIFGSRLLCQAVSR